jgi:hypothetical protein
MTKFIRKTLLRVIENVFFQGRKGINNADEALRYLPISDCIRNGGLDEPKILEVGSGVRGITPYISQPITGVDVSFEGDVAANLTPICLSGTKLPFSDNSYDYVISVDMLEHVTEDQRPKVITELLRVAGRRLFLAVPCGKLAEAHDQSLDDLFLQVNGERHHFLQEHVENGLPEREKLESIIKTSAETLGLSVDIRTLSNVNLRVRMFFMRLWILGKSDKTYSRISLLLGIIRPLLNFGNCYRQIFVVDVRRGM